MDEGGATPWSGMEWDESINSQHHMGGGGSVPVHVVLFFLVTTTQA